MLIPDSYPDPRLVLLTLISIRALTSPLTLKNLTPNFDL